MLVGIDFLFLSIGTDSRLFIIIMVILVNWRFCRGKLCGFTTLFPLSNVINVGWCIFGVLIFYWLSFIKRTLVILRITFIVCSEIFIKRGLKDGVFFNYTTTRRDIYRLVGKVGDWLWEMIVNGILFHVCRVAVIFLFDNEINFYFGISREVIDENGLAWLLLFICILKSVFWQIVVSLGITLILMQGVPEKVCHLLSFLSFPIITLNDWLLGFYL